MWCSEQSTQSLLESNPQGQGLKGLELQDKTMVGFIRTLDSSQGADNAWRQLEHLVGDIPYLWSGPQNSGSQSKA